MPLWKVLRVVHGHGSYYLFFFFPFIPTIHPLRGFTRQQRFRGRRLGNVRELFDFSVFREFINFAAAMHIAARKCRLDLIHEPINFR